MKIVHWAIIFVIIILPFSIICRTTIQKKTVVLQDQTRINNVLDNATFDAVGQILEASEVLGYGKNIPITRNMAEASINRFFQSLAVNFNLPSTIQVAKDYFGQYVPVVLIIGYDGIYIYSYDLTDSGYMYILQPKIPYSYADGDVVLNFTLGNDLKIYIPSKNIVLEGELNEKTPANEYEDMRKMIRLQSPANRREFIEKVMPSLTSNLSIMIKMLTESEFYGSNPVKFPNYLMIGDVTQDYVYTSQNEISVEASDFHKLRRDTIINLITTVLKDEVNEHDTYADLIGVNYDFSLPTIDKEQWQNSINDISVLAFFQGMPVGTDSFYNNYSLGGARIVQVHDLYGKTTDGKKLYHKHNCPVLLGSNDVLDYDDYDLIFINVKDANSYYACKECR